MALWQREGQATTISPGVRTLIGRAPDCQLCIPARAVSGEHASLVFDDGAWYLRDLGSRNGTRVGSRRLEPGEKIRLVRGLEVYFAGDGPWFLIDDGPPGPAAVSMSRHEHRVGRGSILALPDAEAPDVTVFQAGGRWIFETQDGVGEALNGQVLQAGGTPWRLMLPPVQDELATTAQTSNPLQDVRDLVFRFAVSADEEQVELSVACRGVHHDFKSRAHLYLLLTLARQRLADREAGVDPSEEGWLHAEDLMRVLRLDRRALNTQVFRARNQLATLPVEGIGDVIERRDLARQLRLGARQVSVERLGAGA